MVHLEKNLEEKLQKNGYNYFLENYSDATNIVVFQINHPLKMYTIKLPQKKEVTLMWVMEKINKDSIYKNFAKNFENLLPKKYKNGLNVYPTTYGIGISILFSHFQKNDLVNEVSKILKQYGVKYKNEYSDAGWVFRFKISKEKGNIEKINEIV